VDVEDDPSEVVEPPPPPPAHPIASTATAVAKIAVVLPFKTDLFSLLIEFKA
jgi:hypothetical protein